MRGIGELAELGGQQVSGLLADVDGVVADPLERTRDDDHPQAVLPHLRVAAELEDACDDTAVCPVDELVEIDERLGPFEVTVAERVERDPDHLLAPRTHLLEALDETGSG